MEMYEMELEKALALLDAQGRSREDFAFEMEFLPPDPDGGGMFTVQYEVRISSNKTGKGIVTIGGIGSNWVGVFEGALADGDFE